MRKVSFSLFSSVFLLAIFACGGSNKVLISQSEIDTAQRQGNLESLYNKATDIVNQEKGSSKKQAIALQSKITGLLVADKEAGVDKVFKQHNQEPGSIDRKSLLEVKKSISKMQQWSPTDYSRLNSRLDSALANVNQLIDAAVRKSKDDGKGVVASVLALKQAGKLAGVGQPESLAYQEAYESALTGLLDQGNDALAKGLYERVIGAAENGLALDQGNIQFESMMSQGQAGLFEKDFRFAIENGKPELAYQSLLEVADKPIFLQLKKSMNKGILLLANYFAGSAQSAYQKGELAAAYLNFQRGRMIQDKLSIHPKGFIQERKFIDMVMSKARQAEFSEGKRQTLMRVVNEFDPNYPGLKGEYLKLSDSVKNRAMTKLSVAEFKEVDGADSVVASVGRRVGSKLEKILFERLGNEVLIVTNAEQSQGQEFNGLSLKIDGEILQAAIEHSNNQGRRSQKVQTGVNRIETEEYKKWAKRKRGEAPPQYIETPIIEEVVLTVEHIRKQAIAEVAFRIIEPATGKILLTDSFVKDSEFSGESINEYQKGDFHQLYVRAKLPSDIKIMDNLSSELANQLGDRLTQYLQNPEKVFYHKYVEAKAQGNDIVAIELLANAVAIAEDKGVDIQAWYDELKALVLQ